MEGPEKGSQPEEHRISRRHLSGDKLAEGLVEPDKAKEENDDFTMSRRSFLEYAGLSFIAGIGAEKVANIVTSTPEALKNVEILEPPETGNKERDTEIREDYDRILNAAKASGITMQERAQAINTFVNFATFYHFSPLRGANGEGLQDPLMDELEESPYQEVPSEPLPGDTNPENREPI